MNIGLVQSFPLGRFHATPWKAFPFDDPFGEWPPSPYRMLRALLARSYQWERESGEELAEAREALARAFAQSTIAWCLPAFSWRGPGLRQYHPAEFTKMPKAAKKPGMYVYNTTKVQDNFWLTPGHAQELLWLLEGGDWTREALDLLDACLARMIYFGRAESITEISRVEATAGHSPNCQLSDTRQAESVPILCPRPDITLEQLQLTTDDKAMRNTTVPPGAVWKYANRPERPAAKQQRLFQKVDRAPVLFLQFAVGSRVSPKLDHIALIANWFRGRVVRNRLESLAVEKGLWRPRRKIGMQSPCWPARMPAERAWRGTPTPISGSTSTRRRASPRG